MTAVSRGPLRVALLSHARVGGSVRIAMELGDGLARRGHRVHVFARRRPPQLIADAAPVHVHPLEDGDGSPSSGRLDADWSRRDVEELAVRIARVATSSGLDVLHFHYAVPFARVAAAVRSRLNGAAPVVVGTLHGTDVSDGTDLSSLGQVADALAATDALTTVSRSHAALATSTFALSRPPHLIPNFVDTGRFRPAASNGDSVRRRPRLVHVSNFRRVKDPAALARVFARVRDRIDAELWLIGDGEEMPAVRAALSDAGVERHVRFFGVRPDVERLLPHADVLVVTSRAESFCLAALEAAACGVPAVAPAIGGLPEVVLDGTTGLLFDAGDEEAAADAVLRLLDDRDLRRRLGADAIRWARRFSAHVAVDRYEELYRGLLDRVRTPATSLP